MKSILIYSHVEYIKNSTGNEKRINNMIQYLILQNYDVYYYLTIYNKLYKNNQEIEFNNSKKYIEVINLDKPNEINFLNISHINDLLNLVLDNDINFEIIICEYIFNSLFLNYLREFRPENKIKIIMDLHDKMSNKPLNNDIYVNIEDEVFYMNRAQVCICISEKEYNEYLLRDDLKCKLIITKLDLNYYKRTKIIRENNKYLFMCGSYSEFNMHNMKEFIEKLWIPHFDNYSYMSLYISGDVCNHLIEFDNTYNIKLLYNLNPNNLNEYIQNSLFCLNPVYVGTGLKIKSLTYLENSKYFISYPEGVSAIDINCISHVNNSDEFLQQMIFLIKNKNFIKQKERDIIMFLRNNSRDVIYRDLMNILC